jgi:hypothetical protein
MKKLVLFIVMITFVSSVSAQGFAYGQNLTPEQKRVQDSIRRIINRKTNDDYQSMLSLLKIRAIRPGADGNNPDAPNAANYDETKANPYPNLPDPLVLKSGQKVSSAKTWWKFRRPEIVEDFDREIYGRVPSNMPAVIWELTSTTRDTVGNVPVTVKNLSGHVDNSSYPAIKVVIQLSVITPANLTGRVPLIMEFNGMPQLKNVLKSAGSTPWQQQVLNKGWGYAFINPGSIQADNGAGLTEGIIGLMNKGQYRKADDWGALRAWAWGADRAMDYLQTDPDVNAGKVAIEGHSRYGKAALVTLAYNSRFLTGFISSSGEGGAKLHRRNAGEIVENVAGSGEYHWMAGNFIKYAGPLNWGDLPVDSHELIALCAPRPVFISGGSKGDGWVDTHGMFMAAVAAGPVYKLLGKMDMGTTVYPAIQTTLISGDIGYRQHEGGHTPVPNWPVFIEFASRYFDK